MKVREHACGCKWCGRPLTWVRSRPKGEKVHETYRWTCDHCGRHEMNGDEQMSIAEVKLRMLKREAHTLVDYFWKYDEYTRPCIYRRIRKVLKLSDEQPANISKLNEEQLRTVIRRVKEGTFLWYKRAL